MNEILRGYITNDSTKEISSKRITILILILTLLVIIFANVFFNKHIDEFIYNGLIDVIIWSLGFIGAETLGFKGLNPSKYSRRDSYPDIEMDDNTSDDYYEPPTRRTTRKKQKPKEGTSESEEDMQ